METLDIQPYIVAREGLLDAVEALGPHREAVILVGAQAVYVHTGAYDSDFAVSPFTLDADIAIDPDLLGDFPILIEAMGEAGFKPTTQPGIYTREDGSHIDLLVPEAVGGPGSRGARLGVHGNRAARKTHGLEGALVSHKATSIRSMVPGSKRHCTLKVAGPGALLVAKVHKIAERIDDPSRRSRLHKDAFDIYRLLRSVGTTTLADEFRVLESAEVSREVTAEALAKFEELFVSRSGLGTDLVVQHVFGIEDPDFIAESCVAFSEDLMSERSR
ncbi:MAG: hypothetical protein F4X57_13845 [Chloroflexi bacterium]|nr:hypothetical protein [Chloroflexota bacterium]